MQRSLAHGYGRTAWRLSCFVAVLLTQSCGGRGLSAHPELLPRVEITTRADLVEALQGPPDLYNNRLRLSLVAAQGQRVVPFLRQVAADEAVRADTRGNALTGLALLLDSALLPMMVELAGRPGPLQGPALHALSFSPHDVACTFWRSILRDSTGGLVLDMALGGIRYCSEADTALIQTVFLRGVSFGRRQVGERSIELLQSPLADRYGLTVLEGNYPPSGSYRPPARIVAEIHERLCGGPCPPGLVIGPAAVARLRGP